MISRFFAAISRKARYAAPLSLLLSPFGATGVYSQDESVVTVPSVSYSYLSEKTDGRGKYISEYFDLKEVSDQLIALQEENPGIRISSEVARALSASSIDELRRLDESAYIRALRTNPITKPLADGIVHIESDSGTGGGGMSAAAAIEILTVAEIGAEKCQALPPVPPTDTNPKNKWEIYGTPILGRSSMDAVQYAKKAVGTLDGLGRGQFDIRTTKFVLCRNQLTNDIKGIPINVRWVFNVNGQSLKVEESGGFSNPPPGGGTYQQRFIARGVGIQLVLMEIDGQPLLANNPVYLIVEHACIDIWFVDKVSGFDISVPASLPNTGVFCAGGYCKGVPPGLDATR